MSEAPDYDRVPQYVYAESHEEAQRLLDKSYLNKYAVVRHGFWRFIIASWIIGFTAMIVAGILIGKFAA